MAVDHDFAATEATVLANLDRVPARGALIVATWPKPEAGSGFPARCFAIADPQVPGATVD